MINTIRPAIAMIELIFAIVIMGIVMSAAPMLISTANQSTYVSLQQEGINEGASRVEMVLGYAWDENNTVLGDEYTPTILNTTSTTVGLLANPLTNKRIGIPIDAQRSFVDENGTDYNASITLGSESGDSDDIDDFGSTTVVPIESASIDYVEKQGQVSINTSISYGADSVPGGYSQNVITYTPFGAASSTTSNIKNITVTVTSTSGVSDLTKNIVLRAFSCNVGGYKFAEREF